VLRLLPVSPRGYESRPLTELNVTAAPFPPPVLANPFGGLRQHLGELRDANDIVNNSPRLKLYLPDNYSEPHATFVRGDN